MNNSYFLKILIHLGLLLILTLAISLNVELAKKYSHLLFLSQLMLMYGYLYTKKYFFLFLTPIMLVILYIDISFTLGSYAFYNNLVLIRADYNDYLNWEHTNTISLYILVINTFLFYLDLLFTKKYLNIYSKFKIDNESYFNIKTKYLQNIAIIFFIIFFFIPFDVSFLGGSGNMAGVPMTISALILILIVSYSNSKYKYLIYILILIGFASFSYASKREAIFFIFPIIFLEIYLNRVKVNFQLIMKLLLIGFFLLFLILIMSIMRGYGGYNIDSINIVSVIPFLFDYIQEDLFLEYLFNNIETNYTYFHSMQAMEYIHGDNSLLSYGSTVIKFLFITIPSSIYEFKPESIIQLYTEHRDPYYRSIGGSWPINVYSEMFWNFYYFGFFYVILFFIIFNLIFIKLLILINNRKIIYHSFYLYFYMQILMYARGSGFDMFIVYMIFGLVFSYFYLILMKLSFEIINFNKKGYI